VLFVLHLERVTFVVDQLDLDMAIGTIVLVVGGAIGQDILVANRIVDLTEDIRQGPLEHGVEAESPGHLCEGPHLVFGLQIVHAGDRSHASTCVGQFADESACADGEDGDVGSGLDLGQHLVEGETREGIATGSDEDDVLTAFDAADAVERFVESVEEIGIGEAGDDERGEGVADDGLVVGEVGEDVSLEIVGDDGDIVVRTQSIEETEGRILHVADEVVAVGRKLKQHDRCDRRLRHVNAGDGLRDTVFEDEEIAGLEAGNELVGLVENDVNVEIDDGDVDAQRVSLVIGVLDLRLGRSDGSRRRLLLLFLLLDNDGSCIGLWSGRVIGGLLRRRSLLLLSKGRRQVECETEEDKENNSRKADSRGKDHHLQLYSVPVGRCAWNLATV